MNPTIPSSYVSPYLRLADGKKAAGLTTERACERAIELFNIQIRKIERQLQEGTPMSFRGDPEAAATWRSRALSAIDHKREALIQIEVALELAREARQRQLVDLRIRREADARKLAKIREANASPDVAIRYFRNEVRRRLSEEEYEDIWTTAKATMAAEGVSNAPS